MIEIIQDPVLYDVFNDSFVDDLPFYLQYAKKYPTMLECGVGTGRLAIRLVEQGVHIIGVDNSKEMLSMLAQKVKPLNREQFLTVCEQDFCELNLPEKVSFAFYPFCTFNYLLTPEKQIMALKSLRKNLYHDAIVVFDLLTLNTFPISIFESTNTYYKEEENEGFLIRVFIQNEFDQSSQLVVQNRVFKYYKNDVLENERIVKMSNRFFFLNEFLLLLEECGFMAKEIYGDYENRRFTAKSQQLVVIAQMA